MQIYLAYLTVVLIWSTTPLAIQWSLDGLSFITAVTLRMSLGFIVALVISVWLRRGNLFSQAGVWKVYLVASLGIFPYMPLVYWSAQFVPSGLMAVIFALSPFVTGLLSMVILRENPFSRIKVLALLIALTGLVIILWGQLRVDVRSVYGIVGLLLSCLVFSISSVTLKRLNEGTDALRQTAGSLLFSLPGLLLTWWWLDGSWPGPLSEKARWASIYLAVGGSVLGFTMFYYVLNHMSPSSVSLITLVTPILALLIGALVAQEQVAMSLYVGAALVIVALLFYLDVKAWLRRVVGERNR